MEKEKKKIQEFENNFSVPSFTSVQLQVDSYGEEQCGKNRAPSVDPHYLNYSVHFVHSGAGYIQYEGGEPQRVKKGELFFLIASHDIRYYPDFKSPWRYSWFTFTGTNVPTLLAKLNVRAENPVVRVKNRARIARLFTDNLRECEAFPEFAEILCKAKLYGVFSALLQEGSVAPEVKSVVEPSHVLKAQDFIERNYQRVDLSLSVVAEHCNLNKAYLSRLFVKTVGVPMSNYITSLRIHKAKLLFDGGETSVKRVAYMVGFDCPYYFSRVFKALNQPPPCTPSMYVAQVKAKNRRKDAAEKKEE
ncbi:MAG: helix-turn-helix domain-containing protein [Clostridia bacterium]|nr:helix-turn-helix domain-containing protein [Clostridia bacterium]